MLEYGVTYTRGLVVVVSGEDESSCMHNFVKWLINV